MSPDEAIRIYMDGWRKLKGMTDAELESAEADRIRDEECEPAWHALAPADREELSERIKRDARHGL